jgi:hypothetical protein
MEPHIYMSSDEGAPVLGTASGSLIALLDACLVNGFGENEGAGWEKLPGTPTNVAAYRAPVGLRHILQVTDTGSTTATVNAYKTFADGAGTSAFHATTVYWGKSASGTGRQWVMAADNKRFWLFVIPTTAINVGFRSMCGFGELAARHPNDLNASYLIGGTVTSAVLATEDSTPSFDSGLILTTGQLGPYMPGVYGNTSAPNRYGVSLNGLVNTGALTTDLADMPSDYIWSSRILVRSASAALTSSGSVSDTGNVLATRPRGYIPGLLVPMMEMLPSLFPFWTSLGNGQHVIPHSPRRCNILDTGDWEYQ